MIEIHDLNFSYPKVPLFRDLHLTLRPGNIYGLLGRNGAGKTTLLKIFSGLRYPKGGRVDIFGRDPAQRDFDTNADLCFVPEEVHVPPMTPKEYISLFGALYPRFDAARCKGFLKEFGLKKDQRLTQSSLGQKKKFLLSFALSTGVRFLLLDEPTNGLDIPAKKVFRRLLASTLGEESVVLISTHQVRDMENLIDPIIVLDEGKILFNEFLADVGERLVVRKGRECPEGALWSQKVLGGYEAVVEAQGGEVGNMDLETLFVAVTSNPKKIRKIFSAPSDTAGTQKGGER